MQGPIQPRFHSPARHDQSRFADLSLITTSAQLQRLLQDGLYCVGQLRFTILAAGVSIRQFRMGICPP